MPTIRVSGIDQLVESIPHVFGFYPEESVVVVPLGPGLPAARVDLPHSDSERRDVEDHLVDVYTRHRQPDSKLAIACFTADERAAKEMGGRLGDRLKVQGIDVAVQLWITPGSWTDLESGQTGYRSPETQTRMGAEFVVAGSRAPVASRADVAGRLAGDHAPVAEALSVATVTAGGGRFEGEREWAHDRIDEFTKDGHPLNVADAARMLVAVGDIELRDSILLGVDRFNAATHVALWSDLTARAPDDVRTPAATLLGFSSWLAGDGATAWAAYDTIPDPRAYRLGGLLAQVLNEAVPPSAWSNPPTASTTDSEAVSWRELGRQPQHREPPGSGPERALPPPR